MTMGWHMMLGYDHIGCYIRGQNYSRERIQKSRECIKAHIASSPKYPQTVHYRGDGVFLIAGRNKSYRRQFTPEMLWPGHRPPARNQPVGREAAPCDSW